MSSNLPSDLVANAVADAALKFPAGWSGGAPKLNTPEALVASVSDLTQADVDSAVAHIDSGRSLGVKAPEVTRLRHTHHRLAMLLAKGTPPTLAAQLCNYDISRVSILQNSPAFKELIAYYTGQVEEKWVEFVEAAAGLSVDALQELQHRLDERPESLTATNLMELVKLTADRSGNAPTTKTLNVNVNANLGDRLRAARERAAEVYIESTAVEVAEASE